MTKRPLFLARQTYRRRRLGDAARLLPVLGAFLVLAPVLLTPGSVTTSTMTFIFLVWVALIVAAFVLSRYLGADTGEDV
jgi:VIT1/CCC1 family predicted Fe2+/Mn2+ transporter